MDLRNKMMMFGIFGKEMNNCMTASSNTTKIIRMIALSFTKREETQIVKLMRRVRRVRLKGSFR